nr:hypothetical protein [Pyrobaculum aerophilum]
MAEAYKKFGYEGLLSLAKGDPAWTLRSALELARGRTIIVLDELLPQLRSQVLRGGVYPPQDSKHASFQRLLSCYDVARGV